MQYRNLAAVALAGNALAAYVPSEPWSTLTPSATLAHGTTEYTGSFGIAINPIPTTASSSALVLSNSQNEGKAAAATQIADGQIQATTGTSNEILTKTTTLAQAVTQIGDGQIQATTATATKETVQAVTQIGDGQIQATTATAAKVTVQAVTQIGDGQIQATTATAAKVTVQAVTQIGDGQIQATTATPAKVTVQAVTQIGDGQIQATTATATKETVQAVTQIGDGQVQATTATSAKETVQAATQIGDGQVQASTSTEKPTGTAATQIGDGQVQASASASVIDSGIKYEACASNGTLSMTLHDGILTDVKGRIGSIVANQQFQFDGPPPQAGAIYAAGWSISDDGKLAIGNSTTFYQCLSGDFYNLYAENIGTKCEAVELDIVELVTC